MSFSWQHTPKPIIGLSPMDGITDFAYRLMHTIHSKPDVMLTEFTHVEAILHGAPHVLENFLYHHTMRPIIAQIYGTNPDSFYKAALICCAMGFDGIDINMGCPSKNVSHSGGGAALIGTPQLAKQIITSVQQATLDWQNGITLKDLDLPTKKAQYIDHIYHIAHLPDHLILNLKHLDHFNIANFEKHLDTIPHHPIPHSEHRAYIPVSVKTRIGIDKPITADWTNHLLQTNPHNITMHGRTLRQMYTGYADWDELAIAASITQPTPSTFLANGDIQSRTEAHHKASQIHADGALLGRATFGNPYIWTPTNLDPIQKLRLAKQHAYILSQTKDPKFFIQMRKHFGFYIKEFPHAHDIKCQLIRSSSYPQAAQIIDHYLDQLHSTIQ
jgi:tRNA-dihydrouridine synthase B